MQARNELVAAVGELVTAGVDAAVDAGVDGELVAGGALDELLPQAATSRLVAAAAAAAVINAVCLTVPPQARCAIARARRSNPPWPRLPED